MFPVAPFAGAWIEILVSTFAFNTQLSLPSRERGLKSSELFTAAEAIRVAPFAGAWIEIGTF